MGESQGVNKDRHYLKIKKKEKDSQRILGAYSVMASGCKNEGTGPKLGDMLCARKRYEIEVDLNSEISSLVVLKRETAKNVEWSCCSSNRNQHAHGVFPETSSVK